MNNKNDAENDLTKNQTKLIKLFIIKTKNEDNDDENDDENENIEYISYIEEDNGNSNDQDNYNEQIRKNKKDIFIKNKIINNDDKNDCYNYENDFIYTTEDCNNKNSNDDSDGDYIIYDDGGNDNDDNVDHNYHSDTENYNLEKIEKLQEELNDVYEDKNEKNNENNDTAGNKNDIFHCNKCNIVFDSIKEHIKKFHKNDIVDIDEIEKKFNLRNEKITSNIKDNSNVKNLEKDIITYDDTDNENIINTKDNDLYQQLNIDSNSKYDELEYLIIEEDNEDIITESNEMYTINNDDIHNDSTIHKGKNEEFFIETLDYESIANKRKSNDNINHLCLQCNTVFDTIVDAELHKCKKTIINKDVIPSSTMRSNNKKKKNEKKKVKRQQCICDECGVTFNSNRSLALHQRVHKIKKVTSKTKIIQEEINNFLCSICNTKFTSLKSLKLHSKMHTSNSATNSFDRIINSEKKIIEKSGHLSNELFWCDICEKFYDKVFKNVHDKAHENDTKIICMICNKKFDNETECNIHMKLHENHPKRRGITKAEIAGIQLPYECSYCGRQFKKPHEKVKHERIHTGEKPHKCDICGKCFRVAYCLTLHVRTHTNARPYVCPTCNKRFKSVSVYTHHLASHSDERAYKCSQCPKTFKTAVSLGGHRKSHTKPFTCVECNRPFASLYAVKTHMEIHKKMNTNLRHSCIICGAIYAKIFALRDHMKEQHKDILSSDTDMITDTDEIIAKNTDGIIDFDCHIINDEIITTTEDSMDPTSTIIGNNESLLDSKDEITVVDVGNFHTEEIVTDELWLKE